jgi:hypothetical protein
MPRRQSRRLLECTSGFLGPDGAQPDAAEFSVLDDEIAYIFPSDSGLTCVAVSVNLETFRWLRQDFEARYAKRIAQHRGPARRVATAEADGRLSGCGPERNYVRVPWGPLAARLFRATKSYISRLFSRPPEALSLQMRHFFRSSRGSSRNWRARSLRITFVGMRFRPVWGVCFGSAAGWARHGAQIRDVLKRA